MTEFTESEKQFAESILSEVKFAKQANDYCIGDTTQFSSLFDGVTIPNDMKAAKKLLEDNGYYAMFEIRKENIIRLVVHW